MVTMQRASVMPSGMSRPGFLTCEQGAQGESSSRAATPLYSHKSQ